MFKKGDKVRCVNKDGNTSSNLEIGCTYTVSSLSLDRNAIYLEEAHVKYIDWSTYQFVLDNSLTNKTMNLKESFMLAFKSEPEKSLRKAGITNGDDFLTDEGQNVFLSWLLKKNAVAFKTEVVDEILKEDENK